MLPDDIAPPPPVPAPLGRMLSAGRSGLPLLLAGVLGFSASGWARVAEGPGESLYRLGLRLLGEGKTEQALGRLEESVRVDPEGSHADDALLAIARHWYPVRDVSEIGRVPAGALRPAGDALNRIRDRYRGSDSAPSALYALGLIAMEPENPERDLDTAYARFAEVAELYPAAPEAEAASFAAIHCSLRQGERDRALLGLVRFVEGHPEGRFADRARFLLSGGLERAGETDAALQELQGLRGSESLGRSAIDRATLIYRLRRLAVGGGGRPPWRREDRPLVEGPRAGLDRPVGLAIDGEGRIWIADEKNDVVVVADRTGTPVERHPWESPVGVAAGPDGRIRIAGKKVTGISGQLAVAPAARPAAQGEQRTGVRRIGGLAVGPEGEIYLIDDSDSRLIRYGPDLEPRAVVMEAPSGALAGLAVDPDGVVWVGVEAENAVVGFDREGREVRRLRPPAGFRSIRDVAVDAIGDLYVLDDRADRVFVFDRTGAGIASVDLIVEGRSASPTAIAVDASGRLSVATRRPAAVVRFR